MQSGSVSLSTGGFDGATGGDHGVLPVQIFAAVVAAALVPTYRELAGVDLVVLEPQPLVDGRHGLRRLRHQILELN